MIGFGGYFENRAGGFEATKLVRVDPKNLTLAPGRALRLGDSGTRWVFAPDRRSIAIGGYDFGELLTVDVAAWQLTSIQVTPPRGTGVAPQVIPVTWPRSDRVIAYAEEFAAHELFPATVLVIDPVSRKVVRRINVHGSVLTAVRTGDGGAALLVCPTSRIGSTRLLLVDPAGRSRWVPLTRIHGGYVDPGTPGDSMDREPALLAHGADVYAIGARDPVAEVHVQDATVSYHVVSGFMTAAVAGYDYQPSGSGGALSRLHRDADWLGPGRILVTGSEGYPIRNGTYMHELERPGNVLDVVHWRVDAVLPSVKEVSTVVDGLIVANLYGRDHIVLRQDGTVLFSRHSNGSWTLIGTRLIEIINDRSGVELDLHTGRIIRHLHPLAVAPLAVAPWPAAGHDRSAHELNE